MFDTITNRSAFFSSESGTNLSLWFWSEAVLVLLPPGLSQAEPVLLLAAGGADSGPHELHRQPGATRGHVHPVIHL